MPTLSSGLARFAGGRRDPEHSFHISRCRESFTSLRLLSSVFSQKGENALESGGAQVKSSVQPMSVLPKGVM